MVYHATQPKVLNFGCRFPFPEEFPKTVCKANKAQLTASEEPCSNLCINTEGYSDGLELALARQKLLQF